VGLAGGAAAAPFSSVGSGSWNTRGHNSNFATWGAGVGTGGLNGAGVNFPWSGDSGEVNASHTVGLDMYAPWGGTGADWPADLTIILNGGMIAYEGGGVTAAKVYGPVQVKAASSIRTPAWGGSAGTELHGSVSDFGPGQTGMITIVGASGTTLNKFNLKAGDHSGFSGGWDLQNNLFNLAWPYGGLGTGAQVLGTGPVKMDGGSLAAHENVGTLPNDFVLGPGGGHIEGNSGGGLGTGTIGLGGVVSGGGLLTLDAENAISLHNAANTFTNMQKTGGGTLTVMTPGALGLGTASVLAGKMKLDAGGGADWDLTPVDLVINGGQVEYATGVTNISVHALTLGTDTFPDGTYDIHSSYTSNEGNLVDFSGYFIGASTVTVQSTDVIPEPATLSLLGLALLGLRRRRT
jgi:hypothetical protein